MLTQVKKKPLHSIEYTDRFVIIDCWTEDRRRKIFGSINDVPAVVGLKPKALNKILKEGGSKIINRRFYVNRYLHYKKLKRAGIGELTMDIYRAYSRSSQRDAIIHQLKGNPKEMKLITLKFFFPKLAESYLRKLLTECKKHLTFEKPIW